jgi:predicted DsbA family dithiol-disulfide isomerase
MNRLALLALASFLIPGAACAPDASEPGAAEGPVVARVSGEPVTRGELDDWLRDDLFAQAVADKDEAGLHEFRREGLERMISERLLEAEAERRGVEIAELQRDVVGDVSVDDEEVESFYADNRERIVDADFEELAPRIRSYLERQKEMRAWSEFVDGLHDDAGVEVLLEVPRFEVAPVGPALGPADAPVTIVEFSDFNCPFCQRVVPTLKTLRLRYPEQVRIVYRHFPLDMHPRARAIAEAAVCADEQDAFWAFHDSVFEEADPLSDDEIFALAERVGVDREALEACLASGRAAEVVEQDIAAGAAAGVTGTPAFFVNGIRMSGAQPADAFVKLIEQELPHTASSEEGAPSS